jgi:branched-subunit amino acid aminotransferase/4-amino-4-deoxychorismate lyase
MITLPLDSPAVSSGLGLFETMLVRDGRVLLLEEHCERLERSAHALGFPSPRREAVLEEIERAALNAEGEVALRLVYVAAAAKEWLLGASVQAVPEVTLSRRRNGRAVCLPAMFSRALPEHKTTSYAPCVIGLRHAIASGADEGLFVDSSGAILEGTATNVFATSGDALVTAGSHVLPGIVRDWVLRMARSLGIEVIERAPTVAELRAGGFLTSSLTLLAPLQVLDAEPCNPPGAVFDALLNAWRNALG